MDLKFTFGEAPRDSHDHGGTSQGIPLPFAGAAPPAISTSSTLDLRVTIEGDSPAVAVCEALSGDGVSYARAEKVVASPATAEELARAVRSVLARGGATLPEPLLTSITSVVLDLGGRETEALTALGIHAESGLTVDDALQARTGITAGTPIRIAE